jgi:hypothetical protein
MSQYVYSKIWPALIVFFKSHVRLNLGIHNVNGMSERLNSKILMKL